MQVKKHGKNYVQFKAKQFAELVRMLTLVEGYIFGRDVNATNCDYWGICEDGADENTVVNLSKGYKGKPLKTNWYEVAERFPELVYLLDDLNLHHYIGKNYIGNWGMHRHIYSETSTMNLCVLVEGNNSGCVNFHDIGNFESEFSGMTDDNILEVIENPGNFLEETITETVKIKDGQVYSFNTGIWHSHIVKYKYAELFLLHFKDAICVDDILKRAY